MKHLYKIGLCVASLLATSCDYEPLEFNVEKPATFAAQEEIDAYDDLKTYINKEVNPGFKLGAGVAVTDYNQKGVLYRLVNRNFDEITLGNTMKHGSVVQADGSLNLANVTGALTTAKEAGVSVFGHTLVSNSNQNATYLKSLLTPLSIKNPTFTNVLNVSGLSNESFSGWSRTNAGAGISMVTEGTGNNKSIKLVSAPNSSSPGALQLVTPDIPVVKGNIYEVVFYIKSDVAGEGRVSFEGLTNNTPSLDYTESGSASPSFTTGTSWKKIKFRISGFEAERIKLNFDLGYKPNVTYYINVPTLYVYNTNETSVDPNKVWIEAESGTVGSLWDVPAHPDASGGKYVTVKGGNNSTGGPTTDTKGLLSYNVTVNTAGDYALWARVAVTVTNGADDSFFFKLGGGSWATFNGVANSTSFVWYRVANSNLTAGNHTITVSYREDGALLDKMYVTKDGDTPTGMGSTVPVATTVVLEKTAAEKEAIISEQLERWISGMVTASKENIKAWDIVSEPMNDAKPTELKTGIGKTLATDEFYWQDYLGKDYAVKAIQMARIAGNEKDLLFINDTNLEQNLDKTRGLISYVNYLESKGAKVDGIGTQMNLNLNTNKENIATMFQLLAATGKMVRIAGLNVAVGTTTTLATPEQYLAQKEMYKYVVDKYIELVPAKQRYGIAISSPMDASDPIGLWTQSFNRKPAYMGVAEGLKGLK